MKQTEERKQVILDMLKRDKQIYVSDLSQVFDVSSVTIRKDLQSLEEQGLLKRIHGGATTPSDSKTSVESTLEELQHLRTTEKRAIARRAYELVNDGEALLLDASTTTRELAYLLREGDKKNLTVITPALQIALDLAFCDHIQVIQLGGIVRRSLLTTMGPMTISSLNCIHVDKAFIGANGIDPVAGISTQNLLECEVKRHVLEASTRSYVLADSSKMGCVALGIIAPLNQVDCIITDSLVTPALVSAIEAVGVDVILAESEPAPAKP